MCMQSWKLRFRCRSCHNLFSFAHCARVNKAVYCAKLQYSNRMDKQHMFSYTAKCRRRVILAEKERNRFAARECSVPESNKRLWWKHNDTIFACKQSWKKFTGPHKGRHPEVDCEVLSLCLKDGKMACQ